MLATVYIAQSAAPKGGTSNGLEALVWAAILIVVAIVGGLLIMWVRRKTLARSDESESAGSLLEDLRRMRDRGELSHEEYEATRRALTRRAVAKMDAIKAAKSKAAPAPRPGPQASDSDSGPGVDPPGDRRHPPSA